MSSIVLTVEQLNTIRNLNYSAVTATNVARIRLYIYHYLFVGDNAVLVVQNPIVWRVPIMYGLPQKEYVEVGYFDVDAITGKIVNFAEMMDSLDDRKLTRY